MFKFSAEQRIFEIGGVKIGGQPGELPTVLIGSMFYNGDEIVEDEKEGIFDEGKARSLLEQEKENSERTGNPRIVDVVGAWPKSIVKYIDFIAEATDSPFLIDGAVPEVRIAGLKHASKAGLVDRAIYNSIMPGITPEEIDAIREAGLKSSIILTFNSQNPTIQGRLEILDELLDLAGKAGVENCLVDATVLDIPDPGPVGKVIYHVKEKYGLPGGCGAHNAIERWNSGGRLDPATYLTSGVVANILPIAMGANFLLYGPLKNASKVYTPCAVADAYIAYSARQEFGTKPLTETHPLKRIFRKSNRPPG